MFHSYLINFKLNISYGEEHFLIIFLERIIQKLFKVIFVNVPTGPFSFSYITNPIVNSDASLKKSTSSYLDNVKSILKYFKQSNEN